MKNTAQKLILISFVLALIAAGTVLLYLKSLKTPNEIPKTTTVLVAADTIPSRTLIDKKMIKEIQVSDKSIFGGYIEDYSKIVGKYSKETIFKNEGFLNEKLLDKEGDELSLKIDSTHRAISISATGDSGVSDLLKPGDSVDIITYFAEKQGTETVIPDIAKIILQNIKILAINKQLNREEKINVKASAAEKTQTNFLITLSVPTTEIEKLVLAQSIGSIKLALRPLKDNNTIQTNGTTWEDLNISVNSDKEVATDNAAVSDKKVASDKDNKSSITSTTSTVKKNNTSYLVKKGDTLRKISLNFYGDEKKYSIIMAANNIKDENVILTGKVIKIPILRNN